MFNVNVVVGFVVLLGLLCGGFGGRGRCADLVEVGMCDGVWVRVSLSVFFFLLIH